MFAAMMALCDAGIIELNAHIPHTIRWVSFFLLTAGRVGRNLTVSSFLLLRLAVGPSWDCKECTVYHATWT